MEIELDVARQPQHSVAVGVLSGNGPDCRGRGREGQDEGEASHDGDAKRQEETRPRQYPRRRSWQRTRCRSKAGRAAQSGRAGPVMRFRLAHSSSSRPNNTRRSSGGERTGAEGVFGSLSCNGARGRPRAMTACVGVTVRRRVGRRRRRGAERAGGEDAKNGTGARTDAGDTDRRRDKGTDSRSGTGTDRRRGTDTGARGNATVWRRRAEDEGPLNVGSRSGSGWMREQRESRVECARGQSPEMRREPEDLRLRGSGG